MKRGSIVGITVAAVVVLGVSGAIAVTALGRGVPEVVPTVGSEIVVTEPAPTPSRTEIATSTPAPNPTAEAVPPGAYVDYSDGALAAAQGTRVLFFHAPWCPQCRALETDITAQGVPAGITILKVDYDSSTELRQRYDVRLQTTVVALDGAGTATASFVAYDEPTLGAALAGLDLAG